MQVNYLLFFVLGFLATMIIIVLCKKSFVIKEDFISTLLPSVCGGLIVDLILLIITPTVLVVGDNEKHETHSYLFKYIDTNGKKYNLSIFERYIHNTAQEDIIVYAVEYTPKKFRNILRNNEFEYDLYEPGYWGEINHGPYRYFETPPSSIRVRRGSISRIWILDYSNSYRVDKPLGY